MATITARTWGLTLLVGVLGALLGFGLGLVLGQDGWALVGASMGLCAGAVFAGSLMNRQPPLVVPPAPSEPPAPAPGE